MELIRGPTWLPRWHINRVPLLVNFDTLAIPGDARYPADDLVFSVTDDSRLGCTCVHVNTVLYASATFDTVRLDSECLDNLSLVYDESIAALEKLSCQCCPPGYRPGCNDKDDIGFLSRCRVPASHIRRTYDLASAEEIELA